MLTITPNHLFTHQAVLHSRRPTGESDPYGDVEMGEIASTSVLCHLWQTSPGEIDPEGGGYGTDVGWRVMVSLDTSIAATDALEVDGMTLEVDGPPWVVRNPRLGLDSHIEARLREVT